MCKLHDANVCIVNFLCHRLLWLIPLAVRAAATGYPIDIAAEELVDALALILTLQDTSNVADGSIVQVEGEWIVALTYIIDTLSRI